MELRNRLILALHEFKTSKITDYKQGVSLSFKEITTEIELLKKVFNKVNFERKIVVFDFYENAIDLVVLFLFIIEKKGIPLILEVSKKHSSLLNEIPYVAVIRQKQSLLTVQDTTFKKYDTRFGEVLINESFFDSTPHYDCSILLSSSGSTGAKKIIKCTNNGVLKNIEANIASFKITAQDTTLVCLPIYYSYSLVGQFLSHLLAGANIILAPNKFISFYMKDIVKKHHPTNFFITPTLVRILLAYNVRFTSNSLRFVAIGGGYLDKNSFLEFTKNIVLPLYHKTYGLTEAGPRVSTYTIPFENTTTFQPNYLGEPLANVTLATEEKLRTHNGETMKYLTIKSPSIFMGYLFHKNTTHKLSNTLVTEDIVYKKKDAFYIMGRKSDYYEDFDSLWRYQIEDILFKEVQGLLKINVDYDNENNLCLGLMRNQQVHFNGVDHLTNSLKNSFSKSVINRLKISDYNERLSFSK